MTILASRRLFKHEQFLLGIFLHLCCFSNSVISCGQLPQGEVTAMTFTASGFTLPPRMAYSEKPAVQALITTISHSKDEAVTFVKNLVINAVNDVLEEQGRNVFLPDGVISQILQQLNINIEYDPLECPTATDKESNNMPILAMKNGCFIIDGLVTRICSKDMMAGAGGVGGGQNVPGCTLMPVSMVEPIPAKHMTIKGSLKTSNVIMANWSRQMWQNVLNRVSQKLSSGPFAKYFSTGVVIVDS